MTADRTASRPLATDPVDAFLATDGAYQITPDDAVGLRVELIRRAVALHRDTNTAYDRYCRTRDFDVTGLSAESDLDRVPLLPTILFKRDAGLIRSGVSSTAVLETTSSGTQGTVSIVPRCDLTLMRFFASVAIGNRELLEQERFDRQMLHIGPTTLDSPNLWIAYVMAGVSVILPSKSYLDGETLRIEELVDDLRRANLEEGVTLVGPPPLMADLAAHTWRTGELHLGPRSQVVTIGGWKRRSGVAIDRNRFRRHLVQAFKLDEVAQVRDTYNMVELNSVLFECAYHALHVPPWLYASVRHPRTLDPVPDGTAGLLAFLDPTSVSYPGFVLTDDFGSLIRRSACRCGVTGDVITVIRRVNRVETRGCALKLDVESRRLTPLHPVLGTENND